MNETEQNSRGDAPSPQAAKPPVSAAAVLGTDANSVANLYDLSGHPGLDYRVLSLMPANDVVAHFGLT
jgi:hypothetical protein